MSGPKLIIAQEYGDRPDAELAISALHNAGIDAIIQSDSVGGMRDHLAWSGAGFKILVHEEDAATAREILAPAPGDGLVDLGFTPDDPTQT
jgi:hypothetical protein